MNQLSLEDIPIDRRNGLTLKQIRLDLIAERGVEETDRIFRMMTEMYSQNPELDLQTLCEECIPEGA